MATVTSNLGLTKPASSDKYDINVFNTNMDILDTLVQKYTYPVGAIIESTSSSNPSSYLGFGTWSQISKNVIDTGWQNFSWTNATYQGNSQSDYTLDKWRVKDNILYIIVGAGCTSTINHTNEDEIARIPIKGNSTYTTSANRVWNGAVGGSGAQSGFMLIQNTDYISIHIKPHNNTYDYSAPWYSTHFTIPLDANFTFASGSYDTKYIWKRTA